MIVISDTTPIISLLKIQQLELLNMLFGGVLIPGVVYDELVSNPRFQDEADIVMSSPYIKRVTVAGIESVRLLQRATGLDRGESEAIIYTDEAGADLLLMDEAKGRLVARQMGIKVMGTLGILLESYNKGILTKEEIISCLDTMRITGRRIGEELYRQLMEKLV